MMDSTEAPPQGALAILKESATSPTFAIGLVAAAVLAGQEGYLREALGVPVLPASQQPAAEEVLGSEEHSLGGEEAKAEFTLTLTRPSGSGGAVDAAAAALRAQQL